MPPDIRLREVDDSCRAIDEDESHRGQGTEPAQDQSRDDGIDRKTPRKERGSEQGRDQDAGRHGPGAAQHYGPSQRSCPEPRFAFR